jgi:hypothetical protein
MCLHGGDDTPSRMQYLLRAAQPDLGGFDFLRILLGTGYVSYRLSDSDEGPLDLPHEAGALLLSGCRVVHDPRLGNGMRPDVDALMAVAADVDAIYKGGETVLIHCLHGRERTGGVCAAWRLIYGGASLADVEADLKAYGVTGLAAIVDHEILEAVREIARRQGK